MRIIIHFLTLLLTGIPMTAYSQYLAEQLSNRDGLSNSSVNCIFEDSDHNIYIGTWDGLNVFNGRDIKAYRYNRNNSRSISSNVIRKIVEQDSLYLWILTDKGLNRFNKKTLLFDRYFENTGNADITVTSDRKLICLLDDVQLYYYDDRLQTFSGIKPEISHTSKIYSDSSYLYCLNRDGRIERYPVIERDHIVSLGEKAESMPISRVNDFHLYRNTLVACTDSSILLYDVAKNKEISGWTIEDKVISHITHNDSYVLMTFEKGGCAVYDIDEKTVTPLDVVSDELSIFSTYIGSQDIFWIGTDGQGVMKIYKHISPFKTLSSNHPVRSFEKVSKENIWIGTKGEGIKLFDISTGELIRAITTYDGLNSNSIFALKKNKYRDIFVGTDGEGVYFISHQSHTIKRFPIPTRFPQFKSVYSILFTHDDSEMWLGTVAHGMIRIRFRKEGENYIMEDFRQYTTSKGKYSLSSNTIYAIVTGRNEDELLIATRDGGINRFNVRTEQFERLEEINKNLTLSNNDILCMTRGRSNNIWVGTSYGLNNLILEDSIRITEYAGNDDFVNNTIHGIIEDNDNNVWVSTNYGLSRLNMQTEEMTSYTSRDGLKNDEFSDGAYYMDEEDAIYFGGVGGVSYFNAKGVFSRDFRPEVQLSSLRINNVNHHIGDRVEDNVLKLSYGEPYVTLTFIAKEFINNENCEYSYRIHHFAEEWINNGTNPNIAITRLPPGKYRLEVKCTNGDRIWSDKSYFLKLEIGYPWWRSRVAYFIYLIILSAILYSIIAFIRYRVISNRKILLERIEKQHQQNIHENRMNFFTNIAHEFYTPLTLIYGSAQHLLEKSGLDNYTKRYINIVKNNADRMQKLINELMDFRKAESGHTALYPEAIDINQLIEYITDNYIEIANKNKIDFQIHTGELSSFITDRSSLEKIFFNLLSNAFKYTPDHGYIHVAIQQENDELHFTVRNSGKGLTEKQLSRIFDRFRIFENTNLEHAQSIGIGLNLTKSLTVLLGGTITAHSMINEYVEFKVVIHPLQISENRSAAEEAQMEETSGNELVIGKKEVSILIVEDEKDIRELLKDILSPYYNILEAENGNEGLVKAKKQMPDIIVSDILMPGCDGISFTDQLKADEKTAHIPIVIISAKNTMEDRISAFQHNAELFIAKPFNPRHVLITIESIIRKHLVLKEYFLSSRSSLKVRNGKTLHSEDEKILRDVIAYIENNIDDESLNPNAISEFLGISKASFYEKLKALTDHTPSEYIRLIRLNHASKLLVTTNLTVSEIMFKAGFSSKSYFFKEFNKQFGCSPKEYRTKQHTENNYTKKEQTI